MAATILDVAKLCGYSKATVSRAYASPNIVSEKARNKIYEAAQTLNYTPDAIARAMVRGRTDNIGFIIYEKQYPVVLNPFYSPIFESVLKTCARKGYSLFVASDSDLKLPNGKSSVKKQLDGVILAGHTDTGTIDDLKKQGIPVVLLNNILDVEGIMCVATNQYYGAKLVMKHLIDLGHRKIALLAGNFSEHVRVDRYTCYKDSLIEIGEEIDTRFIHTFEPTIENAMKHAKELLTLPDRPTAIFCTNDTIATGAIKTALRLGLRIPQDIAIVGYDNSEISKMIEPELTTVNVDKELMGKVAAELLIAQIEGDKAQKGIIEIPVELVKRQTT